MVPGGGDDIVPCIVAIAPTQAEPDGTPGRTDGQSCESLNEAQDRRRLPLRQLGLCSLRASPAVFLKNVKKKNLKFCKTKPLCPIESINRPEKQVKTKPNEATKAKLDSAISPLESVNGLWRWLRLSDSKRNLSCRLFEH
jgi:hypothetical protein